MKEAPLNEITLRKYEKPYNLEKRQLVKKVCLSLGLLQPGDGRDVVVDVFEVLLDAGKAKQKLNSEQIKKKVEINRQKNNLELTGTADSNIRRQLKRLRDLMIVEKNGNFYHISEFSPLSEIFKEKIVRFHIEPHINRVDEYLQELDKYGEEKNQKNKE